jgi:short-subunit dehydrogenase
MAEADTKLELKLDKTGGAITGDLTISGATTVATPTAAEHAATKAYVLSFSEAIAYELKNTNVKVTAICPGATQSEFAQSADILRQPVHLESLYSSAATAEVEFAIGLKEDGAAPGATPARTHPARRRS